MKKALIAYLTYLLLFLVYLSSIFAPNSIVLMMLFNAVFMNAAFLFAFLFADRIKARPWFWMLFMLMLLIAMSFCTMPFSLTVWPLEFT